ncbi:hypothetical protein CPB86DRAFT_231303 [Serendipita vermifera]|nr:hypothetical protein CPB86DRAFT_231303 [Serendipita vermifera]
MQCPGIRDPALDTICVLIRIIHSSTGEWVCCRTRVMNNQPKSGGDFYWTAPDSEEMYRNVAHYPQVRDLLQQEFHKRRFRPRQVAAINCAISGYVCILYTSHST